MKYLKTLKFISCSIAIGSIASFAQAQTFTTLHSFVGANERSLPYGGVIQSGTTFYGTSWGGGVGTGIVFKINSDGSGKTTLHEFSAFGLGGTNNDGAKPYASLLLSGTSLYGTASAGGTSGWGTVFKVNIDGSGFSTLHTFTGLSDGGIPMGSLIVANNTLYGTSSGTSDGNSTGTGTNYGTVFKVGTSGTGFTTIYSFEDMDDGATPMGSLVLSGGTLYGTAYYGGDMDMSVPTTLGTVFSVTTAGNNFTTIYAFQGEADGGNPTAGLVLSGSTLYGTTSMYGTGEYNDVTAGTVFSVRTNGSDFTALHDFDSTEPDDGANSYSTLVLSGTLLYGTTTEGGTNGSGIVFAAGTTGTSYKTVYAFSALETGTNSDGAFPYAGVILSSGTLYGSAVEGGSGANGTLYSVKTNGTGFTNFHNFSSGNGGDFPQGTVMILSGTTFYGTTEGNSGGGGPDTGTVFSIHDDGTGFTTLHVFSELNSDATNSDGAAPDGGLALSGSTLYGTASEGGGSAAGTIFKVNTDGSGFAVLYTFLDTGTGGNIPNGGIALSGDTIYGTTIFGGTNGNGLVYSINTNGSGVATLYSFPSGSGAPNPMGVILSGTTLYGVTNNASTGAGAVFKLGTNGAGFMTLSSVPSASGNLVLSGSTLYGVTSFGGSDGFGTVYSMSITGSNLTTLHTFDFSNGEGEDPEGGLLLSGTTLYGTTAAGGSNNNGIVFSIGVNGSQFTILHNFSATSGPPNYDYNSDGLFPAAGLTLSGTTLYGTADGGGYFGNGTVFSIVP